MGKPLIMRPFTIVSGPATVLPWKNIDTDIILPARYLKVRTRNGLGGAAFHMYRFAADGSVLKDSPFNRADGRVAPIIIAGENFGSGSSREHATQALDDFGVRAILAPCFASIFAGNAFKNGLLLIELPQNAIDSLVAVSTGDITIDLPAQTVSTPGWGSVSFDIEPFRKAYLLGDIAEIAVSENIGAEIAILERGHVRRAPLLKPKL